MIREATVGQPKSTILVGLTGDYSEFLKNSIAYQEPNKRGRPKKLKQKDGIFIHKVKNTPDGELISNMKRDRILSEFKAVWLIDNQDLTDKIKKLSVKHEISYKQCFSIVEKHI
jgi:hypothetical protein